MYSPRLLKPPPRNLPPLEPSKELSLDIPPLTEVAPVGSCCGPQFTPPRSSYNEVLRRNLHKLLVNLLHQDDFRKNPEVLDFVLSEAICDELQYLSIHMHSLGSKHGSELSTLLYFRNYVRTNQKLMRSRHLSDSDREALMQYDEPFSIWIDELFKDKHHDIAHWLQVARQSVVENIQLNEKDARGIAFEVSS